MQVFKGIAKTFVALVFELLPMRFMLPHLQSLFEDVFETTFDKGNFPGKINSAGMLIRLWGKDKLGSTKGAFFLTVQYKTVPPEFS
jgi:hypothetical protein